MCFNNIYYSIKREKIMSYIFTRSDPVVQIRIKIGTANQVILEGWIRIMLFLKEWIRIRLFLRVGSGIVSFPTKEIRSGQSETDSQPLMDPRSAFS